MNRESLETILKQYFGDRKTAQKFAAAMREGLKTNCYENDTRNALSDELSRWCAWQGLECKSVDEMLLSSTLSYYQRDYLLNHELRWDGVEEQDPDEEELELINEQLIAMMERNGFTDISTGGGCEAWSKDLLPDGSLYMLVTVGMDGLTYQELADVHQQQITACVYMDGGEWLDASQQHFTWEEFKEVMRVR